MVPVNHQLKPILQEEHKDLFHIHQKIYIFIILKASEGNVQWVEETKEATVTRGGGSVMVWGGFVVDWTMNSALHLQPSARVVQQGATSFSFMCWELNSGQDMLPNINQFGYLQTTCCNLYLPVKEQPASLPQVFPPGSRLSSCTTMKTSFWGGRTTSNCPPLTLTLPPSSPSPSGQHPCLVQREKNPAE